MRNIANRFVPAALGIACLAGLLGTSMSLAAMEAPPPPGTPKDFQLPRKTTFSLDNGLRVTMVPFGTVPKISLAMRVRTGNLNEGDATWLADLTGELMTEGAGEFDSAALAIRAAELGGTISVSTGPEMTTISMSGLADKAGDAVGLLADVIRRPTLPESDLERIRQDYLRNLSIARTRPGGQAAMAFYPALYGDHPFATVFPTDEQLRAYTIEDVREYYAANFGARRSHLFVVGRFDPDALRNSITARFQDWPEGPDVLIDVPQPTRDGSLQIVDRPGSPQSTISIGIPVIDVSDAGFTRFQMTDGVLGGTGFLSRFYRNIREDKGYSYSPASSVTSHYRDTVWSFNAEVATPATGATLTEFFKEIQRLQQEPPSGTELGLIRGFRGGIFVLRNASRGGIISTLGYIDFHELPDTYLTEYLARMGRVTAEQVTSMASSQLPLDGMTIVVVGDRSIIDAQLADVEELEDYLSD